jgi:hypothetical protein
MKPTVELQPGEQVVLVCRRHWVVIYPLLALYALVGIVPLVLAVWLTGDVESDLSRQLAIGAAVLWALAVAVRAYFAWYRHQHDTWMITNQRIVDSLRRHWFHHQVSSADLIDIQDVSVERSGVLETMLDFGNLRVQTASEMNNFLLARIPSPSTVLTTLDRVRDEARRNERRTTTV